MPDYPEIDCPEAYEKYHGKGVLFRTKLGNWEGKFFVGLNSKYILIDVIIPQSETSGVRERLPLTQEILENIKPAPKEVLDSFGGRIAFVIPQILIAPHQ